MRYRFIESRQHKYPITTMCRILEVHRSGFYAWRHALLSRRAREDQRLKTKIKQFWMESGCNYGYRNIALDLKEVGETCGKNSVLRLMRSLNIASHRRYRRHKGFNNGDLSCVADNRLNRQFDTPLPNLRWVTDFTYIRTKEGWLYATIVMDLFSRRVIGWSLSSRATSQSVMDALLMAVWRRQPKEPVLVHSDQGAQYTARDWLDFLKAHQLEVSMSRRGNCHDNAVAESFFSSLKLERVKKKIYATRAEARLDLVQYIEGYYNSQRRHSNNGGLSPKQFEDNYFRKLSSV